MTIAERLDRRFFSCDLAIRSAPLVLILMFLGPQLVLAGEQGHVSAAKAGCDQPLESLQKGAVRWTPKGLDETKREPYGYNMGGVFNYEGGDIIVTVKGKKTRLAVKTFGTDQYYSTSLDAFLMPISGADDGPTLPHPITTHYRCPIVDAKTPAEDYSRYLTVVELKSAVEVNSKDMEFQGVRISIYETSFSGKDPQAGQRRFVRAVIPTATGMEVTDLPVGWLPGTRIVIPKGVTITITTESPKSTKFHTVTGGAIDIRLDQTIRIESSLP